MSGWTAAIPTAWARTWGRRPLRAAAPSAAWLLGASVPLGHGAVVAQWSLARPDWKWEDGSTARNAQLVTLGYTYNVSPRTTLYAFAGYASNYTLDNQFDPGHSHTSRFGTGISHRF